MSTRSRRRSSAAKNDTVSPATTTTATAKKTSTLIFTTPTGLSSSSRRRKTHDQSEAVAVATRNNSNGKNKATPVMGLRSAKTRISSSTQKSPGDSKKNKNKNSSNTTSTPTPSSTAKKVRKSATKSNGTSSFPPTKSGSLESSVSVTNTVHEESLPSGRPKRKAASSVRYGSYKDSMDNVDFSLMVDSFASATSATAGGEALARSKSSSSVSKRKPSKSPKNKSTAPAGVRVKRNALMTSKKSKSKTAQPSLKEHHSFSPKCAASDQQRPARLGLTTLLPPVLIERYRGDITPDMLRSLSSNTKIDIFNRKTGRIMRGEDGVHVKDLVQALTDHAEYEPIFPTPKRAKKENTYRESRSSANARVSEEIQPQIMIRESTIEGRHVLVTGGSHKGLIGKVYACIPGNWYMITDISNPEDFDYIIHSKNLKVVNRIKHAPVSISSEESTGLPDAKERTNTGATSKSRTGHSDSPPTTAQDILSLRRKIKELEEERSDWKRKVDAHTGEEEEAIIHQKAQKMRSLERVEKALEETQSELQTKIFLHEILRSSQM